MFQKLLLLFHSIFFVASLCLVQMVPGSSTVPTMQRIPLPGAEMLEEEPLYVNAKQYHRILKRRQARAKLEAEGKIPKERRVSSSSGLRPPDAGWPFAIPSSANYLSNLDLNFTVMEVIFCF